MNKAEVIVKFLVDHAPEIFTGLAMAGTVTTTALAVKATPKALDELDKAYRDKALGDANDEPLTKKEVVKATWKCYIPAAVSGGMTIGFIFAANYAHVRKETALAAMGAFFEQRYLDYQNKVIECTDEETDRMIRNEIAQDKMIQNPPTKRTKHKDDILCYEPNTEQYFVTNERELLWARLSANKMLSMEENVTLNQVLSLFADADSKKWIGDKLGWYMDGNYYEFIGYNWGYYGRPWLDIDYDYKPVNNEEVAVLTFSLNPVREEAYDVDSMMEYAKQVNEELSIDHIKEEIKAEEKKSQKKH